jgi:transposase
MVDIEQRSRKEIIEIAVKQDREISRLQKENELLRERFRLSQLRQFGASREKFVSIEEAMLLFDEAEAVSDPAAVEPTLETITYKRAKTTGRRDEQLEGLPEEIIEHTLPADEQICSCCNGPMHKMGENTRRELKIIPAQAIVVKHVAHVYSCRHCQKNEIETPVAAAPLPDQAFPKSMASATSVAYIIDCKYVQGLPLYRQEQILERNGIFLSRQTLANWILKGADHLILIYNRLKQKLLTLDILHADETTLQVLHEEDRAAETKSYIWLYRSGRDGPPIVLFEYKPTRSAENPKRFLKDFRGYLHADAYAAYDQLEGVTLVGCWAHARRGFSDVLKTLTPQMQKKSAAAVGLSYCNKLFAIEKELQDVSAEERKEQRLKRSAPVLAEFKAWLTGPGVAVLPAGGTGKAIAYCNNQWSKLTAFLLDGRLEIDNNRSERSIKPFVIGRKNWLFANTPKGATASATIYSIVETAKENGLNPLAYLTYLFEQIPSIDKANPTEIDRLLPTSADLPEHLRTQARRIKP